MKGYKYILAAFVLFFIYGISNKCASQIYDNFSDGNFTANPPWYGDQIYFQVVNEQLNSNGPNTNGNSARDTIALYTINEMIDSTEWQFLIDLKFNPTADNLVRVYLVSDVANLKGQLNGYYVELGRTSADSIKFFRQNGWNRTLLFTGNSSFPSNVKVRIKITRNNSGQWRMYADPTGGTNFQSEGSAFYDNSIVATSYFGVYCRYMTDSRYNLYFFDDFYVGPWLLDTVPPQLISITASSVYETELLFNEPLDPTSAQNVNNYFVNNSIGTPQSATLDGNNPALVHLIFDGTFEDGLLYTMNIQGIRDISGNLMPLTNGSFYYYYPVVPAYRDIVINEIMADPSPVVQLPEVEFVEIYNKSNKNINLQNWKLSDGATTGTFPAAMLFPDEYAIVCKTSDTALFSSYGKVIGLSIFPSLNNSGDNVILKSNLNVTIDSLFYDISWYADPDKDDGGYTLEQINPYKSDGCPAYINWKASNSFAGGTPGSQNSIFSLVQDTIAPQVLSISFIDSISIQVNFSEPIDISVIGNTSNYAINNNSIFPVQCIANTELNSVKLVFAQPFTLGNQYQINIYNIKDCSGNAMQDFQGNIVYYLPVWGDIIINEIMADPTPPVGLPEAEFIELYNKTNYPINIKNWKLSASSTSTTVYNIPDFTVPSNGYVVLCPISSVALFDSLTNVLGMPSFPTLNNTGSFLALRNANNEFIDSLIYQISWYKDLNKDDGGYTLELINPNKSNDCPAFTNWNASNSINGGTPGAINSVFSLLPDTIAPKVLSVIPLDSVSIKVVFSKAMNTSISYPSNYSFSPEMLNIAQIITTSDFNTALIMLSTPLLSKTYYKITLSNMADCSGNPMPSFSDSVALYTPQMYDVVINEIMADPNPQVQLPALEYVELFNNAKFPINLSNWQFDYGTSSKTLPECVIKPNSYVLLTKNDAVKQFADYGNVFGIFTDIYALTDDGLPLMLKNQSGDIIHFIQYEKTWYGDKNKTEGGWALEQIDPANPCGEKNNWRASIDKKGGTPSAINSVFAKNPDNNAPILVRVAYISDSSVILHLNEIMHPENITNTKNYNITPDIGQPAFVSLNYPDKKSVTITFPTKLKRKTIYNLTVTDTIKDCIGNKLAINSSMRLAIPEEPLKDKVLINEILSKPKDGGVDFVEIINISDDVYDFKDLLIANFNTVTGQAENTKAISEQSFLIFPRDYYVLTTNPDIVLEQYTCGSPLNFVKVASMPTFANDEGTVAITNKQIEIIDKLVYNKDMHFALLNSTYGVSLERLSIYRASDDDGNWFSASQKVGFATPALQNSQFTDVSAVRGELSLLPEIFSPDNDGFQDVLTVVYKAAEPGYTISIKVYDQAGRFVNKIADNYLAGVGENYFTWNGLKNNNEKAPIGIYIIFVEVFNLKGEVKQYKKVVTLAGMVK